MPMDTRVASSSWNCYDKVHRISSLAGARTRAHGQDHHSISDRQNASRKRAVDECGETLLGVLSLRQGVHSRLPRQLLQQCFGVL